MSAYDDDRELTYSDLLEACERNHPQFSHLVIRYLEQSDPPENAPEEPPESAAGSEDDPDNPDGDDVGSAYGSDDDDFDDDDDDDDYESAGTSGDAWTLHRLQRALAPYSMWGKNADEKYALRRESWDALLAAPYPPPRLRLGDLLIELYERGDEWSRSQLVHIFREAQVGWGLWKGMKRIYKLVEERHDPEMFGILAWRLDAMSQTSTAWNEVTGQTFSYMRRRAWRYLRQLGQSVPELYPQFAVQVLRHYPEYFRFYSSWVASQIWAHEKMIGSRGGGYYGGPPSELKARAFHEAWKISPEPLLRLLEDAANNDVCQFAIRSLKADFPAALREVDARWIGRIGSKNLSSVHGFVVELLKGNPEFHQSKLKELGLHDMVVGLLTSDDSKASAYAVDYAKSHAPDIPVSRLIEIAESGNKKVREFVRSRLAKKTPKELGVPTLIRMLTVSSLDKLAKEKFEDGFKPGDLSAAQYVTLANGDSDQKSFVKGFFKKHKVKVPTAFLRAQAEDKELYYWDLRQVMNELGKRKAEDIGIEWIKNALIDSRYEDYVQDWLRKGMLKGKNLDVDWLKGLVGRVKTRSLAINILGNTKLLAPARIGLSWLLSMTRHADESLATFAHRYLLEHFEPDDFALEMDSTNVEDGIDKIWSLLAPDQPEPVRTFASVYLKVHHKDLSSTMNESRQYGIKPKLPRKSYTLERVRPLFSDANADMRWLGRAIGRCELVRWKSPELVYELAASRYREARLLASEALLHIGESDADPKVVPPAEWLVPARVFALAESPVKATREIALTLIRRHYGTLGGAEKLGWLMESPDREVRLFAVRLLWEKHRPVAHPAALESTHLAREAAADAAQDAGQDAGQSAPPPAAHQRFDSLSALQHFLRTVLFGLPTGRMERRDQSKDASGATPDRPLPASVAKRRLIGVVRDMGIEDRAFAGVVAPVLEEFMHSQAKGEWHSCVAALAQMRTAHPDLETALPARASA